MVILFEQGLEVDCGAAGTGGAGSLAYSPRTCTANIRRWAANVNHGDPGVASSSAHCAVCSRRSTSIVRFSTLPWANTYATSASACCLIAVVRSWARYKRAASRGGVMEAATRGKLAYPLFRFSSWTRNSVDVVHFSVHFVLPYAHEPALKFRYQRKAELHGSG